MSEQRLSRHGRNHGPTGSDPVDAIFFDVDNQGGYLDVTVNDTDGDGNGLLLRNDSGGDTYVENFGGGDVVVDSHADFNVTASTDISLRSGAGGNFTVDQALFLISILTGTSATINVSIEDGCYFLVRNVSPGTVEYMRVGSAGTDVKLRASGRFNVMDSAFVPVLRVFEDGNIDMFAQGNVIDIDSENGQIFLRGQTNAELDTGETFTVYDGSGNPALEVRADGSVHIQTGTSVVADL